MERQVSSSPLHQRILDFEARIRKWRLSGFRNVASTTTVENTVRILRRPPENQTRASGCHTSPMPRRIMNLDVVNGKQALRRRPPHEWNGGLLQHATANRYSDSAEVQRRYEEIKARSGKLTIQGVEYSAHVSDLDSMHELGFGTCGHVFKMRYKPTGHIMAVKQMARTSNKDENKRVIMDLDVVLRSHDCPHIVRCFGCFITECDVWVCMELMATCLEKLSKRLKGPIPEPILGKMAVSVVKALDYLKDVQGIIHRDVKPSNMLLDWNGTIKLCDFGISGRLVDSKAKTRTAGCAAYMAPERIDPPDPTRPDYDIRADVWSLGISLVELAMGRFPYDGCNGEFEILSRILSETSPQLLPDQGFSEMFCDFVGQCLTKDYRQRPKYKKLLEHPFIKYYETAQVDVATWFSQVMMTPSTPDANSNFQVR
uniref:mitogen-activated protein kinase kinase n=2 Tax=Plectus sambesii TaxID=2011161 RepID=A0A914WBQ5_9BILA